VTRPPVLTDEDFPVPVARALRQRGRWPVEIVAEGPLRGAADRTILDHAAELGGVLVSHNRRDRARFRAHVRVWRRRGNYTLSVLLLPRDLDDDRLLLRTELILDWYAACGRPKPETLIWNDVAQALIHGHRAPGYDAGEIRRALGQPPPAPAD
jgi:hypothetical protein